MLIITIPGREEFNEATNEFTYEKSQTLCLEHSLVSLSKWESKWHKPFISKEQKTTEETIDYIRCMTITQNVNPNIYGLLTTENINDVKAYVEDSMTATWFTEDKPAGGSKSEQITSELIYYWMIALQIPFECQKWHLNRLLTLIRVCNIKNAPAKKYSKSEILSKNAALNAARKKKLGTSG